MKTLEQFARNGLAAEQAAQAVITAWSRQNEKERRYQWHQYFLALRRGESGELHRRLAESLETAKSHCGQVEAPAKQVRKTPFINRDFTKKFLLEAAHLNRAHKFDQVSEETLQMLNVIVRTWCVNHIRHLPSKGKRV